MAIINLALISLRNLLGIIRCLDPVFMGISSLPYLVDFIQEKLPVLHADVPPGAAHLLVDAHRTLGQLKPREKL
jgi:hypothetical protein